MRPTEQDDTLARLDAAFAEDADALFERAPCGYLTTLPDGAIVRVNGTFLGWTGYEREELVGRRRFVDLLTGGGRIYHETHYAPLLAMQGAVREIALEIVRRDGTRLSVLVNASMERTPDGTPRAIRVTVFDASQRREYERELLRAREEERAARAWVERLQHVSAALVASAGPREIGRAVLEALLPVASAGQAALLLAEPGSAAATPVAWRGAEPAAAPASLAGALQPGGLRVQPSAPFLGLPAGAWGDAIILMPLAVGERLVGALCLGRAGPPALADEERVFLVAVAEQCALALERARLQQETEAEGRRARLVARAAQVLQEAPEVEGRLVRLLQALVPEVGDEAWFEPVDAAAPADLAAPDPTVRAVARRAVDRRSPVVEQDGERSSAAMPLIVRGQLLGALVLVRGARRPFGDPDLALLADIADRAALALDNARLYERERDVARTLQQSLLAGVPPRDPRLQTAAFYRPAVDGLHVGGDWHDAFATRPGCVAIVVGDVVGRGLGAASAMGQLRSAVRALVLGGAPHAAVLERLDRFVEGIEAGRMATIAFVELDLAARRARVASAGHPPPLVLEPGAAARFVWEGRSPPLGVYEVPTARDAAELELAPGSRLLLYTDGLVERRAAPLDVGLGRLAAAAERERALPLPGMVDAVVRDLLAGERADDDVCVLAIEIT